MSWMRGQTWHLAFEAGSWIFAPSQIQHRHFSVSMLEKGRLDALQLPKINVAAGAGAIALVKSCPAQAGQGGEWR